MGGWRWMMLGLVLIATPGLASETPRDPMIHFFDQGFHNLPDEVEAARKEGKVGIFVMFETADCPWCDKMMKTVLSLPSVQAHYRKSFRALQVDMNGDATITDFDGKEMRQREFGLKHNPKGGTPVFVFFGLDGKVMAKHPGTATPEEFMWFADFITSGRWQTGNFVVYKRERRAAGR
jgi:thioredoxin-related protein